MKTLRLAMFIMVTFLGCVAEAAPKDTSSAPRTLKKGDVGSDVSEVRRALGLHRGPTFGPRTQQAVKRVQAQKGLPQTGIIDAKTRKVIFSSNLQQAKVTPKATDVVREITAPKNEYLSLNAMVPFQLVLRLQTGLDTLGFGLNVTGKLDVATIDSYIEWQSAGGFFSFLRGKKGIITETQIKKIEKQAAEKMATGTEEDSNLYDDVRTMFARKTKYTKCENTYVWVKKKIKRKGKWVTVRVRVDLDPWTKKGLTSTKAPLLMASQHTAGTIAVDPEIIPYGSIVEVMGEKGPEYYIAADTGGAVISRKAARKAGRTPHEKAAIVVDFCRYTEPGGSFGNIRVAPYKGPVPFIKLSEQEKASFFNLKFAMAHFNAAD